MRISLSPAQHGSVIESGYFESRPWIFYQSKVLFLNGEMVHEIICHLKNPPHILMSGFQCLTNSAAQVNIMRCVGFTVTATVSLMMQRPGFCLQVNQNMCLSLEQQSVLQSCWGMQQSLWLTGHLTAEFPGSQGLHLIASIIPGYSFLI